jgi:hypothetical protein
MGHFQSEHSPTAGGVATISNFHVANEATRDSTGEDESRVSLAPLDPEDALRALLATPPVGDQPRAEPEAKGR